MNTWQEVAEAARKAHHETAASTDVAVSSGKNYTRSRQAFKAAIRVAYPTVDCDTVYGVWIDCMEPVAYCVEWIKQADRDELQRFTSMGRD
jgi:hypothetical protein